MADSGYRMPVRKRREQAAIVCWIGNLAGISGCNWALDCAFVAAFSLFSGLMAMTGGWHWGYVQCLQKAGYKKLFPHLQDGKNGYKKNMCRMFGEYLDLPEVNIVDPLKVFHSFRHTVVTKLTGAGVNEGLKRAMVGHDIDTKQSAHDDYTHLDALTIPNLQTAINKLHYEDIDFAKLKLPANAFLDVIAKRIEQQAEAKKREEEKAKPKAKAKGVGTRQRNSMME